MREIVRTGGVQAGRSLGIVLTGGTAGLGRAMVREFLGAGDRVVICGRDRYRLESAMRQLVDGLPGARLHGMVADVSVPEDAAAFASFARERLGVIDRWINNAGTAGEFRKPLWELDSRDIDRTCRTNLSGTMMLSAEALRVMRGPGGNGFMDGHIFNMGFSLAGMRASPTSVPHRVSKRAVALTTDLLRKELKAAGIRSVGVHEVSPGLVLTGLLLKDAGRRERRLFNVLAEMPETVAADLVPKIRDAHGPGGTIRHGSVLMMLARVAASRFGYGNGRFFDADGRRVSGLKK